MIRRDIKSEKGPWYHNPVPLVRLTGDTNDTNTIVDGVIYNSLVDSGAQTSTIMKQFCYSIRIAKYSLDGLVDVESMGGIEVPSEGYVEVSLQILVIRANNHDVLLSINT